MYQQSSWHPLFWGLFSLVSRKDARWKSNAHSKDVLKQHCAEIRRKVAKTRAAPSMRKI